MPSKIWEIVINEKQEIIFNETPISIDRLGMIMKAEKERPENEKVANIILKAHKLVPFGTFVMVMDMARENDLLNLVIATDSKKDKKEL